MYDIAVFAATLLPTILIVVIGYLVYRLYLFLEPKIYHRWLSRRLRGADPKDPAPPQ
jgi:hypothetical protein